MIIYLKQHDLINSPLHWIKAESIRWAFYSQGRRQNKRMLKGKVDITKWNLGGKQLLTPSWSTPYATGQCHQRLYDISYTKAKETPANFEVRKAIFSLLLLRHFLRPQNDGSFINICNEPRDLNSVFFLILWSFGVDRMTLQLLEIVSEKCNSQVFNLHSSWWDSIRNRSIWLHSNMDWLEPLAGSWPEQCVSRWMFWKYVSR